ncbi:aldo/keto reductase [Mesorhizobium sp. M1348]
MSFGNKSEVRPWVLGKDARPLLRAAWEGGINFFDTANVYVEGTSEEITGLLLKELAPRDEIVLATKVFNRVRPGPNGAGCPARRSFRRSIAALSAWAPTT